MMPWTALRIGEVCYNPLVVYIVCRPDLMHRSNDGQVGGFAAVCSDSDGLTLPDILPFPTTCFETRFGQLSGLKRSVACLLPCTLVADATQQFLLTNTNSYKDILDVRRRHSIIAC